MRGQEDARRVVLHLGMHKTGTSSIQAALQGYRDERIEYADLGPANHSLPLQRAFQDRKAARGGKLPIRPDQREAARKALEAAIGGSRRSLILSAEGLSHFDRASVQGVVEFLRPHFDRIETILYVRPPESYARSAFQERTKFSAASFDVARLVPPYRDRVERWAETLGEEPTYVLYDRATLHEGDVVADFAWRLDLDPAWLEARARTHPQNRNASLSAEATAALYLLRRRRGGPPAAHEKERAREKRMIGLLQGFGQRRFDFGREVMDAALAGRAEDIAWIEGRLGRSFPREVLKDPVIFGSEGDVLDYGEAQAPALAAHLEAKGLLRSGAGLSTVELLEALARQPLRAMGLRDRLGQWGRAPATRLRALLGRVAGARR
ncbi:hypothetical protein Rumeso_04938 [Rubellimicrobium mesophilum DSM 19309]|uniref:Uncharacterized protein n=1 Tax=Rubellimicrobium mesophilum DSM 19309 TaxID=442562 RepID=A0A017HAQ5_9RHOB|nr:hypothetical protein [Rubellimicrobium mesophilum]EYD71537.1 hypothetical protein Rumeso_04938 [Rubellimicrobium mesophilum DSM 19309]